MDIDICDKNEVLSQAIWFNPFRKINGNIICAFIGNDGKMVSFFINDFIISPENKNTVHISGISEYLES